MVQGCGEEVGEVGGKRWGDCDLGEERGEGVDLLWGKKVGVRFAVNRRGWQIRDVRRE